MLDGFDFTELARLALFVIAVRLWFKFKVTSRLKGLVRRG